MAIKGVVRRWRRPPPAHAHHGCGKHPIERAYERCSACDRRCCPRCVVPVRHRVLCIDCGLVIAGVTPKRRNRWA